MQCVFGAGKIAQWEASCHWSHGLKRRGVGSANGKVRCLGHGDVLFPHDVILTLSKYREVMRFVGRVYVDVTKSGVRHMLHLMNYSSVKCHVSKTVGATMSVVVVMK